jgi:CTP synthase (UTP-ammonia lyase)
MSPNAARQVVTELACSLAGTEQRVRLEPGSLARRVYGRDEVVESYFCRFGPNPAYVDDLARAGLVATGVAEDGAPHVMELRGHPFFLITLAVPQARSAPGAPHPVLAAFVAAAAARRSR